MASAPRVAIVLGTRPEIIKLSPVIRALAGAGIAHFVVHTNQHYSEAMDRVFFEELELPAAERSLEVGSGSHGAQTGAMLARLELALLETRPAAVLVQGDTNTVLAGALAAAKLGIPVGHVEAGLRSYDRSMPEELNRIVADHLSQWFYAPTPGAVAILAAEGISGERVLMTGNTVVDAVLQNGALAERRPTLRGLGVERGAYALLTLHRAENTDRRERFEQILEGLERSFRAHPMPVLFPVHPRTAKMVENFSLGERLRAIPGMRLLEPLGYLDFLLLEKNARLLVTDSGGVQEEGCILGVPCVTLRENTERPETVAVGASVLAGFRAAAIAAAVKLSLERRSGPGAWPNPFGDGHAGERIAGHLGRALGHA